MGRCRRHPHHLVVGVCAYCLNDHLSALLEKLEGYEDPTSNPPSHYMSPHALTSSITSTSCGGTIPETPPRRASRMLSYYPVDDISSRGSGSSQFSLPFSPHAHRLETHYNTTSSNLSPQNQVFFGNPDFIKGEIPRKHKSSFWSFLHRRKDGYFDGCGTAHWHHDFGLEDVRNDHIYDDDGLVHMPPTSSQMRAQHEKGRLERHGVSKMSSSSMREVQAGSSCREKVHVSLPYAALSPKHDYHQRLSPSKQEYAHNPSSIPHTIRRSPLRHESHGDERDSSEELHGNHSSHAHDMGHYAHGSSQRHSEDRKNRHGSSSSWMSLLFPQKIRRSKSISGLSDVGSSGPPPHTASPDAETRARSVYFADHAYGSPSCIPMRVSRGRNVPKRDNRKSLNMLMHAHVHSKSPKSRSFRGYFGKGSSDAAAFTSYTNRAHSPTDFSSFEAYTHSSPPISSLLSKKRSEAVSIDCGKDNRVSPIAMLAMKRQGSKRPHSPFSDVEYVSTLDRNQVRQQLHPHVDGIVPRCSPNFEGLENSSAMLSDDEFRRSPMLAMKEQMQSPTLAPIRTKCTDRLDEHYGNQDAYSYSTRSWSTALRQTLAPMLGIGRAKKQGMKKQESAHNDPIHHVQHRMDESNSRKQSPLHDDHDYIDLHLHHHHHHHIHDQHAHGSIKAPEVHAKEPLVLPGLDSKGPPEQYSFLSRDYSAFSFYFSPRQAYGRAEEASYSSHKPMQAGIGDFGAVLQPNSLSSRAVDSIGCQNGRGRL